MAALGELWLFAKRLLLNGTYVRLRTTTIFSWGDVAFAKQGTFVLLTMQGTGFFGGSTDDGICARRVVALSV